MTDYRRLSKRELLLALRERLQERKRIIALFMSKAQTAREAGSSMAGSCEQYALELGRMGHDPVVVEAARAKGVTDFHRYVDKENARDHRAERRRRAERAKRLGGGAG